MRTSAQELWLLRYLGSVIKRPLSAWAMVQLFNREPRVSLSFAMSIFKIMSRWICISVTNGSKRLNAGEGWRSSKHIRWVRVLKNQRCKRHYRLWRNELLFLIYTMFSVQSSLAFFLVAPDTTVTVRRSDGTNNTKDRITDLVFANSDGYEKIALMFIGSFLRPRTIKKKYRKASGLVYHINQKAWMTEALFNGWLMRFDRNFKRLNRHVILLIKKCTLQDS